MSCPRITVDLRKIRENANTIAGWCHERGMTLAAVTKGVCAVPEIVAALEASDADFLADARVDNLERIKTRKPRMLIRIPMPSEAERLVLCADMSLISARETVSAVGAAARAAGVTHRVILSVDMGDLREGVWFKNRESITALAEAVLREPALELYGVGMNLSCFGGILPDETNMGGLVEIAEMLRAKYGLPLPLVSGGATSNLPALLEGRTSAGINNLRCGESILVGFDSSGGNWIPGLHHDTMTITAELVEVQTKPSKPIGPTGANAFGEAVVFEDKGPMLRGIAAIGRHDVDPSALTPLDGRVEILGASSDHLLLDLSRAPEYRVGGEISFLPGYGSVMRAFAGPYVRKVYIGE